MKNTVSLILRIAMLLCVQQLRFWRWIRPWCRLWLCWLLRFTFLYCQWSFMGKCVKNRLRRFASMTGMPSICGCARDAVLLAHSVPERACLTARNAAAAWLQRIRPLRSIQPWQKNSAPPGRGGGCKSKDDLIMPGYSWKDNFSDKLKHLININCKN